MNIAGYAYTPAQDTVPQERAALGRTVADIEVEHVDTQRTRYSTITQYAVQISDDTIQRALAYRLGYFPFGGSATYSNGVLTITEYTD